MGLRRVRFKSRHFSSSFSEILNPVTGGVFSGVTGKLGVLFITEINHKIRIVIATLAISAAFPSRRSAR